MPEAMDWMEVLAAPCPHCGADVAALDPAALPDELRAEGHRWEDLLGAADPDRVRVRPADDSWTALEYACHVRDVFGEFTRRVTRALVEDEPEFGWWDHEAAVTDEHYNEQDPVAVGGDLMVNAEWLAGTLALVEGDEWDRAGTRRTSERMTVAGLGRFALHESAHHRADAVARLA